MEIYTISIKENLRRTFEGRDDFDPTDGYGKLLPTSYISLHDPNLKKYFNRPSVYKHMVQKNLVVHPSKKVVCSLKEFNDYKAYVRNVMARKEIQRRKMEEKEQILKKQQEAREKKILQGRKDAEIQYNIEKRNEQKLLEVKEDDKRRRTELMDRYRAKTVSHMKQLIDQLEKSDGKKDVRDEKAQKILYNHLMEKFEVKEGIRRKRFLKEWRKKEMRRIQNFEEQKKARVRQEEAKIDAKWLKKEEVEKAWLQREHELKANHSEFLRNALKITTKKNRELP